MIDVNTAIECLKSSGVKIKKPLTCAVCIAFAVRNNKYVCLAKPFRCDETGHPVTRCPKPLTEGHLKKIKDLLNECK